MQPLTIYLAKLLGFYCVIVAAAMMVNRRSVLAAINALVRDSSLLLFVDIVTLAIGLALVIGHNVWSGGALPIVITIVGWASLIKGLVFLFLSPNRMVRLYEAMQYEKRFFIYMGGTLALGLYMVFSAFSAR